MAHIIWVNYKILISVEFNSQVINGLIIVKNRGRYRGLREKMIQHIFIGITIILGTIIGMIGLSNLLNTMVLFIGESLAMSGRYSI